MEEMMLMGEFRKRRRAMRGKKETSIGAVKCNKRCSDSFSFFFQFYLFK
jgi:hypothetical protein